MKMKVKEMKHASEMLGVVVATEEYGNVKLVEFSEDESWGHKFTLYLDKFHSDNVIGSFNHKGTLVGGAFLVTRTTEEVTEFID
jgi:hypothetical protein